MSVRAAIERLERRGAVRRTKDPFRELMIAHVAHLIGQPLPAELEALYREGVKFIAGFNAVVPVRSGRMGWRDYGDEAVTSLLKAEAVPVFTDGCGSYFGLDLSPEHRNPAVYFFDHERGFEQPEYAVGSSLGRFLILLSLHDQAWQEGWQSGWELQIDPDIENCPRAPAIWNAGV